FSQTACTYPSTTSAYSGCLAFGEEPAHERTFQDGFAAGFAQQLKRTLGQSRCDPLSGKLRRDFGVYENNLPALYPVIGRSEPFIGDRQLETMLLSVLDDFRIHL